MGIFVGGMQAERKPKRDEKYCGAQTRGRGRVGGEGGGHAAVDRVHCAGFGVSPGILGKAYIFDHKYRQFRLAVNSVSQLLRKSEGACTSKSVSNRSLEWT